MFIKILTLLMLLILAGCSVPDVEVPDAAIEKCLERGRIPIFKATSAVVSFQCKEHDELSEDELSSWSYNKGIKDTAADCRQAGAFNYDKAGYICMKRSAYEELQEERKNDLTLVQQSAIADIIKDCNSMESFRFGDHVYSCKKNAK